MSVDLEAMKRIHRIETEIDNSVKAVKALLEQRAGIIEDLDEYKALEDALASVKEARVKLKMAVADDRDLNKLEVDIAEAKYKKRDLAEILSHHLVVYTQDTGRDVIRDREGLTRQIELKAKEGKRALDQERLPLGLNRHLGEHIAIPAPRVEVKAGEEQS